MNKKAEERAQKLFAGIDSSLPQTDPEFAEIITNFSQSETITASIHKESKCFASYPLCLGVEGMGEFQNMLHAALHTGIDPIAIKEVVYQATAYLGIGRTYDFLTVTNQDPCRSITVRLCLLRPATTTEKDGWGLADTG